MPLGSGCSAEEQFTGKAEHGGLQIKVYPMQAEEFERRFPTRRDALSKVFYSVDESCISSDFDMGNQESPGKKTTPCRKMNRSNQKKGL